MVNKVFISESIKLLIAFVNDFARVLKSFKEF